MLFLVCCQAYHDLFWLFLLTTLHLLPLSRPNLTFSYSHFRPTLIVWLLFTLPSLSTIVYLIAHLHDHSKLTNLSLHLYSESIAWHLIPILRQVFPLISHFQLVESYILSKVLATWTQLILPHLDRFRDVRSDLAKVLQLCLYYICWSLDPLSFLVNLVFYHFYL